jgi:hypothetical protein
MCPYQVKKRYDLDHVPMDASSLLLLIQVEQALLERKKQELLAKYVSEDLMKEEQVAKDLLGK